MDNQQQTPKRPVYSNLDSEGGKSGAIWENQNSKTGQTFLAVQLDCLAGVEGVNITLNANKFKEDGDSRPHYYGKQAVAWLGASKHAGIPTLTVKLTDDDLIEAAGGRVYHEMFDNSVHVSKGASQEAPAEDAPDQASLDAPSADLSSMTVADLRSYADQEGIDLTGLRLKADILAAIQG